MVALRGFGISKARLTHFRIFHNPLACTGKQQPVTLEFTLSTFTKAFYSSSHNPAAGDRLRVSEMASKKQLEWTAKKVRDQFLKFFESHGHTIGTSFILN
jgi:hypothetical protein